MIFELCISRIKILILLANHNKSIFMKICSLKLLTKIDPFKINKTLTYKIPIT